MLWGAVFISLNKFVDLNSGIRNNLAPVRVFAYDFSTGLGFFFRGKVRGIGIIDRGELTSDLRITPFCIAAFVYMPVVEGRVSDQFGSPESFATMDAYLTISDILGVTRKI